MTVQQAGAAATAAYIVDFFSQRLDAPGWWRNTADWGTAVIAVVFTVIVLRSLGTALVRRAGSRGGE